MRWSALLLLLVACGSGESNRTPENEAAVELPQPSGPPVVQQVDNGTEPDAPSETAPRQ